VTEDSGEPKLIGQGRYLVRGSLGHGAQAETLWGEDTTTGAQVAIKRFQVRGARSWKDVELAEREANVLSRLNHPNLPKYVGHFEEDGALYLVMQKIEGVTLAELREKSALDQAIVTRFLFDVAETLSYLHGLSPPIVHRDIKPHNVILRPDGGFSLVDFGSVREKLKPEGGSTVVGTFGYMAPEQFQGRAGPATDVYGAGATAIACLSGRDPEHLPHRGLAIDVPSALSAHVDRAWVELLTQLVEPDPDKRPRSLKDALDTTLGKKRQATAVPRPAPREPASPRSRKQARRAEKRDAKRERKAARRARLEERRLQRPERGNQPFRGWLFFFIALGVLAVSGQLGALFAFIEGLATFWRFPAVIAIPILSCWLAFTFARRGLHRRRAERKAAEAEQRESDALEHAEQERRISDLFERVHQALEDRKPHEVPDALPRQRVDDDSTHLSGAASDADGPDHPPENHRNPRIYR